MKRIVASALLLLALVCIQPAFAADEKPMTNADVINMVRAKLPESTMLLAVRAAQPDFDTSANGLIKLKSAGVPQSVVEAMISAEGAGGPGAGASAGTAATPMGVDSGTGGGKFNPEEVMLVEAGQAKPMRYLTPQMRQAARALGFGGFASYAVLRGTKATLRITNKQPEFLVAVPSNAQAESYYTLVNLAVRNNGTREIMTGGGYMSYSSGVANDRVVPTTSEKLADQSTAQKDFVIYRIKTTSPMAPGEYAVVLYNSQIKMVGFFTSGMDSFFDFGVD